MQVDNRVTFWFDQSKKRKYGNLDQAIERYEAMSGKKYYGPNKVKINKKSSIHHIDADRQNDHPNNMFICENDKQHSNLHNQLQQATTELIKSGVLGFDWNDKKYFVSWKPLAQWIRSWREKGQPNWHCNVGLLSKDVSFLKQMHQKNNEPPVEVAR
jgi:hypothetical protein